MPGWLEPYVLCFVPLFAAIDAVGVAPFYFATVEGEPERARRRVLFYALVTAGAVGLVFLFLGNWLLGLLGVTVPDFQIAGGVLLLGIAMVDLVMADKGARRTGMGSGTSPEGAGEELGAVPLGVPLVVGPATITTLIALYARFGLFPVLVAFLANIALAGVVFWQADRMLRFLGRAGARAIGKVASLLLAAIAVKLVRVGLEESIGALGR